MRFTNNAVRKLDEIIDELLVDTGSGVEKHVLPLLYARRDRIMARQFREAARGEGRRTEADQPRNYAAMVEREDNLMFDWVAKEIDVHRRMIKSYYKSMQFREVVVIAGYDVLGRRILFHEPLQTVQATGLGRVMSVLRNRHPSMTYVVIFIGVLEANPHQIRLKSIHDRFTLFEERV